DLELHLHHPELPSFPTRRSSDLTDFAKKHFDMDSVEELRADIKKRIEREKEAGGRAVMGEKIVEELVKANDFPMPEGLIASGSRSEEHTSELQSRRDLVCRLLLE